VKKKRESRKKKKKKKFKKKNHQKKKEKKKKKKEVKGQKKLEMASEEEYVPPIKTLFTLHDYMPKGFFTMILQMMNLQRKKWPNVVWFHGLMSVKR